MSQDPNESGLLPWVDIETFGLNARFDPIIEVGIKITDADLNTLFEKSWLVWSTFHDRALSRLHQDYLINTGAKIVLDMHSKNNLFHDAKANGALPSTVAVDIQEWLVSNDVTNLPMCGSSVQFDRGFLAEQMGVAERAFHYRNIDVSTLKELCRRYRPDLFAIRPDDESPHRVMPDLVHSIAEFKFYREEFLNA